jgi:hypothetical protein
MVEAGGVELFHGSLVSVIYRFHQGNEVPKVHIAGVIVRVSHRVQRRKRHRLPSSGESHLYRTQLEQNRLLSRHWTIVQRRQQSFICIRANRVA